MCFSGTGVAKGFTLACVGVWEVKVGVKGGGRAECVCVSVESRRTEGTRMSSVAYLYFILDYINYTINNIVHYLNIVYGLYHI